jgi:ABC-type transporter Mla MlaB component
VEAGGSERLLDLLRGLVKDGVEVRLGGTGNLVGLLKRALQDVQGAASGGHWLLLLELYQLLGMRSEFEELAVEYAVALEISPPSWEEAAHSARTSLPRDNEEGAAIPSGDTYFMAGTVSGDSEKALRELTRFAAARQEVHIDVSRVPRVDFGSMGNFLNALVQLNGSGKRVFVDGANEMVAALFSTMGVEQFATLERKKWC